MSGVNGASDAIEQLDRNTAAVRDRGLGLLGFAESGNGAEPRSPMAGASRIATAGWPSRFGAYVVTFAGAFFAIALVVNEQAINERFATGALGFAFPGFLNSFYLPLLVLSIAVGACTTAGTVSRLGRRVMLILSACACAAGFWLLTFSTSEWGLLVSMVLVGLATGTRAAAAPSVLVDGVPPHRRVRVVCGYVLALGLGAVTAGIVMAIGQHGLSLTWRGVSLIFAVLATVAVPASFLVREPGLGTDDLSRLDGLVHDTLGPRGALAADLPESAVVTGLGDKLRQVLATRAGGAMAITFVLFGIFSVPLQGLLFQFEIARHSWASSTRLWVYVVLSAAALVPVIVVQWRGDNWMGRDARRPLAFAGRLCTIGAVALVVIAFAGNRWVTGLSLVLVYAASYLVLTVGLVVLLSVVDPSLRTHAAALAGVFVGAGYLIGGTLPGQLASRYGLTTALVFLALNYLGVAGAMRVAADSMHDDLGRIVDTEVSREELRVMVSNGRHVPLLACRDIDFSYDQLQVLFGVDFTVDDGELVALLGTNGAGKSTLLRVVSGLGMPSRGHVHFRGADITRLGAERRVGFGITQMPGGRAVFGNMTVADNLRTFAFSIRKSRREVEAGIDATFDAFPQLADRRDQHAGTLSGGEQQMLGLGKAFILRPRLLLIDELSLGLAPIVVGRLLDMVRRINDNGTAVVLVEQSLNIALTLAHHAYFMEKGEIRFDGPSDELIARPDLVRSVFLEGAAKGLAERPHATDQTE